MKDLAPGAVPGQPYPLHFLSSFLCGRGGVRVLPKPVLAGGRGVATASRPWQTLGVTLGDFLGFSIPDGAWLPPELLELLPDIKTVAELKVTIAAINETLRVGVVEAIVSLSEFEALTGLDRKSVSAGIKRAVSRGTIKRQQVGNTYLYRLHFNEHTLPAGRGNLPLATRGETGQDGVDLPQNGGETGQDGVDSPPLVVNACTSTTLPIDKQQNKQAALLAEMRQLGVVLKVAQKLVAKYDPDYLREKLEMARYAVEAEIAENGPGWFVASVREDWQAPLGFERKKRQKQSSQERYLGGKYGHLIEH